MKQLTSYNRAAGYLNKIFDLLNETYFESTLSRPTITIQSTPKAYGHFSLRDDTWISKTDITKPRHIRKDMAGYCAHQLILPSYETCVNIYRLYQRISLASRCRSKLPLSV